MFHCLEGVLSAEELATARRVLDEAKFVEGARTARGPAAGRKANLQLDRRTAPSAVAELDRLLVDALCRSDAFNRAVLPRRFTAPLYARYGEGMEYGPHVDNALMGVGGPAPVRADMAITVFLSDPDAYEGGELCVETALGEQTAKLPAGSAVVYPADTLHRVAEVTRGERLVAVTWAQSVVADPAVREVLADLRQAAETVQANAPGSPESLLLARAFANLLRRFAET